MRLPMLMFCSGLLLDVACLVPVTALAQGAPAAGTPGKPLDTGLGSAPNAAAAGQAPAPAQGSPDPVVGSVEGHLIYLRDLGEASKTLPENLRGLPFDTLYPVLLDRMIDHEALVIMSRRKGWSRPSRFSTTSRSPRSGSWRAPIWARSRRRRSPNRRYRRGTIGNMPIGRRPRRCVRATSWSPPRPRR